MGRDIDNSHFTERDFLLYDERLRRETGLLREWFAEDRFSKAAPVGGFELEAWLVNPDARPVPLNEAFLERLASDQAVMELSRFNVELNTPPWPLGGATLAHMRSDLDGNWRRCQEVASTLGAELMAIGILPTVRDRDLTLETMSRRERFLALNEQVLRLRHDNPIHLDIRGVEHLQACHHDVMLEAAATSFQVHLQVPPAQSVRFFNAATVIAAPMVAATANSPFLFGRLLWDETRIPLFEQAVAVSDHPASKRNRVTLGHDYVRDSLMEFFDENLEHYAVLLPALLDQPPERLSHLRLLNGTIWRWNRPLIGFDADGTPHLRIEHRVIPAGPSVADMIANAAFFFGLVQAMGTAAEPPEEALAFEQARENLYAAARDGLHATVVWIDGRSVPVRDLLLDEMLPAARAGLQAFNLAEGDIALYLGIIESRLRRGQTGAEWQKAFVRARGPDMRQLARAYRGRQRGGEPVHEWGI